MRPTRLLLFAVIAVELIAGMVMAQNEPSFEVPVQLIGFPVIIFAVKLSNFLKKLAYAVNPSTYHGKSKRSTFPNEADVAEVEKRLIAELGEDVCVYERVCRTYAEKAIAAQNGNSVLDWENVFERYQQESNKKFYLLSVFLGDIVKSPELCHQLVKRGRGCK